MLTSETQPISVDKKTIDIISRNLEAVPPAKFDIARQVRVYEAYFQYVDFPWKAHLSLKKESPFPKTFRLKMQAKS